MPDASAISWTPDQARAVRLVGRHVVVGAAAGSGKTAVLAARAVELLTTGGVDADGRSGSSCGVANLLVATFTNAAAAEMRQRIALRLQDAIDAAAPADRPRLQAELDRLPAASIGTLGSFSANLVRRHHAKVGIDPGFAVLPQEQAGSLRIAAAKRVIEERLANDEDAGVSALLDELVDGDVQRLTEALVDAHGRIWSLPNPKAWLKSSTNRLVALADAGFADSFISSAMAEVVARESPDLVALGDAALRAVAHAADEPKLGKVSVYAGAWADVARSVGHALRGGDLTAAAAAFEKPAGALRGGTKGPLLDALKSATSDIRDAFKSEPLATVLTRDIELWNLGLTNSLPSTRTFAGLLLATNELYTTEKRRLRSLDFSDLEHFALHLLRTNADVREELRRRYQHVLIDEGQDLNALQDELVEQLVAGDGDTTGGKLFLVGDVKQSVYGFRYAEPRRFLARLAAADGVQGRADRPACQLSIEPRRHRLGQRRDASADVGRSGRRRLVRRATRTRRGPSTDACRAVGPRRACDDRPA